MCDEGKEGHKEFGDKMHGEKWGPHGEKWGHAHPEMKKMMMKKIFMKKIMEHLSEDDKKKLLVKKLEIKISTAEQKVELMKEKKKLIAAKMDIKTSEAEQKIELLKTVRDMLK